MTKQNQKNLKIFVGYDSREHIAFHTCKESIMTHASVPVDIQPIKLKDVKKNGLYWRDTDKLSSTEFTFSRFLVPELCDFKGWALFIDCDFIALTDIKELFDHCNEKYALMCAQHDYTPRKGYKMDGQIQHLYPRKNWSSMMLFNCEHVSNQILTKSLVNNPKIDGKYLHRFSWLHDNDIGKISHEWNWLVNWYHEPKDGTPKFLHYTEGGPWFDNCADCAYANEFYKIERKYLHDELTKTKKKLNAAQASPQLIEDCSYQDPLLHTLKAVSDSYIDPDGEYYGSNTQKAITMVNETVNVKTRKKYAKVAAIFNDELAYTKSTHKYDEYLQAFVYGCGGILSDWQKEKSKGRPIVMRGVGKSTREGLHHCWKTKREYYYIDTGYFGNDKSKLKGYHRVTKNNLQNMGPIIERPDDRLLDWKFRKFKEGTTILVCPPSDNVMKLFDLPASDIWVQQIKRELQTYTDRPIEIRIKPSRTERFNDDNLLPNILRKNDIHCLITYNSIAALEALMNGVPAITLGPNCAHMLCNTNLADIECLTYPSKDDMYSLMCHLSYCQFTREEMINGFAWSYVQ